MIVLMDSALKNCFSVLDSGESRIFVSNLVFICAINSDLYHVFIWVRSSVCILTLPIVLLTDAAGVLQNWLLRAVPESMVRWWLVGVECSVATAMEMWLLITCPLPVHHNCQCKGKQPPEAHWSDCWGSPGHAQMHPSACVCSQA